MIDLKVLRDNPEVMKKSQKARGENPDLVDAVISTDDARRTALSEYEVLRAEQNVISKSVAAAKGEEKSALLEKAKSLSTAVKSAEAKKNDAELRAKETLMGLSNFIDPIAPIGGEADYKVIEEVGTPRDFKKEGFEAKDHVELGRILGAIDVERGTKVSGSRFYYLTGMGAMLEFALVNFAIASAGKNGFIPVIPPVLVKSAAMEGTGFLGQAAENVFHLKEDDFYLVG
ncbi:MAG: serine--tRNA ligase, partial [Acidobacteria bacterium]|nr:serine--tRNA ligase [Acidobacteriota bacterium]